MFRKNRVRAYFTVEAAMVIPLVISGILMTVMLFLFQYNRCLWEQDLSLLCLYGSTDAVQYSLDTEDTMENKIREIYLDKYIMWDIEQLNVSIQGHKIIITGKGIFSQPVEGWNLFSQKNSWGYSLERSMFTISPIDCIRLKNKWKGGEGKEDENRVLEELEL